MIEIKKTIPNKTEELILGIDLEWTKNYRIKDGNNPFCFSFVYFKPVEDFSDIENYFEFGFESYYIENKNEIPSLVSKIESRIKDFLGGELKIYIVGHQLSSDISVLMNLKKCPKLTNIAKLKDMWKKRRNQNNKEIRVFDTRYDLEDFLKGKSRRLVDVCKEVGLDVTQNEIKGSMTKMQNVFFNKKDYSIFEKIAVLNLRHSLSSAILFNLFIKNKKPKKSLLVNKMIYCNAKKYFKYLNENCFIESI